MNITLSITLFSATSRPAAAARIVTHFVHGRPLSVHGVNEGLLNTLASYLAHIEKAFPVAQDIRYDEITDMIRRNVLLGLGEEWVNRLSFLEELRSLICDGRTTAIDGRMMPHEWFRTGYGYVKMDGVDHHADQFFPGCQDIAWDIAGVLIEFSLDRKGQEYLVSRYGSSGNGSGVHERLPFYVVAYLAYRLGYTTFAADELGSSPDGVKFRALVDRYTSLLKQEILRNTNRQ
ncbi:MAG: hypothetical protein M1510_09325 [Nitrospirae bacterium]|nr:hypothetical protein [Nitrospirota bacterium]